MVPFSQTQKNTLVTDSFHSVLLICSEGELEATAIIWLMLPGPASSWCSFKNKLSVSEKHVHLISCRSLLRRLSSLVRFHFYTGVAEAGVRRMREGQSTVPEPQKSEHTRFCQITSNRYLFLTHLRVIKFKNILSIGINRARYSGWASHRPSHLYISWRDPPLWTMVPKGRGKEQKKANIVKRSYEKL